MRIIIAEIPSKYPFSLDGIPILGPKPAPTEPRAERERLICSLSERCADCPYPSHGFVCWRKGGECMRTDLQRIEERRKPRDANDCRE